MTDSGGCNDSTPDKANPDSGVCNDSSPANVTCLKCERPIDKCKTSAANRFNRNTTCDSCGGRICSLETLVSDGWRHKDCKPTAQAMEERYELGYDAAVREIVAWLRGLPHECNYPEDPCDCLKQTDNAIADAIEAGEHRA